MQKDLYLIVGSAGFILAIFLSSFCHFGFSFFIFTFIIAFVILIFQKFFVEENNSRKQLLLIFIFIICFSFGILRYEVKNISSDDSNLQSQIGKSVSVEAIVFEEPTIKNSSITAIIKLKNLTTPSSSIEVSGLASISADLSPKFQYGDLIKIDGVLSKPENFDSGDGKIFDYVSYLSKDDIFYKIDFAKVSVLSSGHGNLLKSTLFKLKNNFVGNINKLISEPQSSLLSGIILGAKNSMGKDVLNTFQTAGVSHIVALSGYNITIVADFIMKVLSFLPRSFSLSFGAFGIILFVLMTGASSTAIRSAVMSLIVLLANASHRKYQIGRAILAAGLFMIVINPKVLVFDMSFQLSFLATVAIVYVAPILKENLSFVTDRFGLRDIISSTVSAQCLVLPLILYKTGIFSFVALPANFLILFVISAVMLFGFLTGVFGFIWVGLSLPFAWISWFLLTYILKVAGFFANLPFSSMYIKFFPIPLMIFLYILIILIFVFFKEKSYDKIVK